MLNSKIGFVSLGCPKALVDSERIITQLKAQGYELVNTYEDANVVIINTCGFVESAIEESMQAIEEAMAINGRVIVTGCLGAKAEKIRAVCPDILHISGPHAYEEVIKAVHQHVPPPEDPFTQLIPPQGIKLTPRHYAYLKISEGCNHSCSFCIIPSMRGKLQSYNFAQLLSEAHKLKEAGVKELLVISQDTSAYGVDKKYETVMWQDKTFQTKFYDLCQALNELGIWVRLHYVYPYPHVDNIIPLMHKDGLLPYLDIPLQHASAKILKAMKRPANQENTLKRIQKWREICPDITIRSTFIVGFPGETDDDFEELIAFIKEAKLDRVGCFQYSPVEGAAANALEHPVPDDIKQARFERFMETQAEISFEKLKSKRGQVIDILIDDVNAEHVIARSIADAPEIDGLVYLPFSHKVKVGEKYQVKVHDSDHYDLFADWLA